MVDWNQMLDELLRYHRGKVIGVLLGLFFGVLTVVLGFWKAVFIGICIFVGYVLGKRADDSGSFWALLERFLKH